MRRIPRKLRLLGSVVMLMLAAAVVSGPASISAVRAQTATPGPDKGAAASQQFSENDVKAYANAMVKVQEISVKWRDELRASGDPSAATAIQQKAESEAVAAVKGEGISVEKYNQIALATETDADLRNKVLDYISRAR